MAQPLPKLETTITEHPNAFKLQLAPTFNLHIIFLPYGKSPNLFINNYWQHLIVAMDLSSEQKCFLYLYYLLMMALFFQGWKIIPSSVNTGNTFVHFAKPLP